MMQTYIFQLRNGRFSAQIEAESVPHARLRGALLCIAILGNRDLSRAPFDIRQYDGSDKVEAYLGDEFFYPFEASLRELFANCGQPS
jgi:hypothetical protein